MDLDHEQRLKASLHYTVGKMCEEQEARTQISYGKQVMATINEILWRQIKIFTLDLESFAKHGKRTTIQIDDVKLLVRRNEDLKTKLETLGSSTNQQEETAKSDKGKALVKKKKLETAYRQQVHDLESDEDDMFS